MKNPEAKKDLKIESLKNKALSELIEINKFKNYSAINDIKSDLQEKSLADFIIYNDGAKEFLDLNKENLANEISKFEHEVNESIKPEIEKELSQNISDKIDDKDQFYEIAETEKIFEIENKLENATDERMKDHEMEI